MTEKQLECVAGDLLAAYHRQELCMWEFLASRKPVPGMTLADCVKVYCTLLNISDGDEFYRVVEDEKENLVTGERTRIR